MTKKKTILITGGAGYIGQFLTKELVRRGYRVHIADRNIKSKFKDISPRVTIHEGDLRDENFVKKAVSKINICIHLAAELGGYNYLNTFPATILSTNDKINAAVFGACAESKIDKIVYVSSGMVFEKSKQSVLRESDLESTIIPTSAYSFSKLAGEFYCRSFQKEFGLDYNIVRLFNVYGPIKGALNNQMGSGHIIQELVDRILSGEDPLKIMGDGKQVRCFTYITDAINGIVKIIEDKKFTNSDFNISSNEKVNILQLAKLIWKKSGKRGDLRFVYSKIKRKKTDVSIPSIAKARKYLGFKTRVSLNEGLNKIIADRKTSIN